jgi:hypothetical protein
LSVMKMLVGGRAGAVASVACASSGCAERAAKATGQLDRLHLWPDHEALSRKSVINAQDDPAGYLKWLHEYWNRVSEWPGKTQRK